MGGWRGIRSDGLGGPAVEKPSCLGHAHLPGPACSKLPHRLPKRCQRARKQLAEKVKEVGDCDKEGTCHSLRSVMEGPTWDPLSLPTVPESAAQRAVRGSRSPETW